MSVSYGGDSITFADGSTVASGWAGFKNRIINGAMVIDQRNAGASANFAGIQYGLDRWASYSPTTTGSTLQQVSDAPSGFNNSLKITIGTGASPSAAQQNILWQPIEGYNIADMGFGANGASTLTFSFWTKSSLTGTFNIWLQNSASNRSYVSTYTINSANTWEQKIITVVGDTTGTWLKTNGAGLVVGFSLGCGSNFNATVNSWSASDYKSTSGATNIVATSGATWQVTGIQLEKGSTATSFDYRPYGTELVLCKRYYDKTFPINTAPAQNAGRAGALETLAVRTAGQSGLSSYFRFSVPMRTTPTTVTFYNPSAANGQARNLDRAADCTGTSTDNINEIGGKILYTLPAGTLSTELISVHWSADAEL